VTAPAVVFLSAPDPTPAVAARPGEGWPTYPCRDCGTPLHAAITWDLTTIPVEAAMVAPQPQDNLWLIHSAAGHVHARAVAAADLTHLARRAGLSEPLAWRAHHCTPTRRTR
jgi:hypothetical protein